jgi:hypothetical protein
MLYIYIFLISFMCATSLAHFILLNLVTLITVGETCK